MATKKKAANATKKRATIGRPPRAGKAAERIVALRLTAEEYAKLERDAEHAGLSVSAYLRGLVFP